MKFSSVEIQGGRGKLLKNTLFSVEDGGKGLALLFPGAGYTCDMPALYYPRNILLSQKYDVLSLEYSFQTVGEVFNTDLVAEVLLDGEKTLESIQAREYPEIFLVGKSLGTRVLTHLLNKYEQLNRTKAVYLTPVFSKEFNAATAGLKQEILMAIGTEDPFYNLDMIQELQSQLDFKLLVLEGADHGLEVKKDCLRSLEIMKAVCEEIQKFITDTK